MMRVVPNVEALVREAEKEPDYPALADYAVVMRTLRAKGFSYRNVAEWLRERGVEVDHNGVYRVLKRVGT